jgi:uridine kinase
MKTFMRSLASNILNVTGPGRRLIAIDGVDGSGKTSFAANLVSEIRNRPATVIHADDFLNPSAVRHAKGRASPEGFWKDTYNYSALQDQLLRPLGPKGAGWYSPASYNAVTDRTAPVDVLLAPSDALVFVEGMFLHRTGLLLGCFRILGRSFHRNRSTNGSSERQQPGPRAPNDAPIRTRTAPVL